LNRPAEYELFKHLDSVLFNGDEKQWKARRRLLLSLYSITNAAAQMDIFNQESQRMLRTVRPKFGDSEVLLDDVAKTALHCAVRIIFRSAFGVHLSDLSQLQQFLHDADQFIRGVMSASLFGSERLFLLTPPGRRFKSSIDRINQFARQVFDRKMDEFEVERGQLSLLEYLDERNSSIILEQILRIHLRQQLQLSTAPNSIAADELITLDQVIGETLVFVFGGIDTATTALTFTLYLLGTAEAQIVQFCSLIHSLLFVRRRFAR
jgi:cytochrome P450